MFLYKNKIVITGGSGRFGSELKKIKNKYKLLFPNKRKLNILNLKNISKYLKSQKACLCTKGFSVIHTLKIREFLYIWTELSPPSFDQE